MQKNTSYFLLTTIALVTVLFSGCSGGAGSGTSGAGDSAVAATVNGRSIMLSEVDRLISQQMQGQQAQMSPLQLAQARLQVLDGLIQKEVLFQRAEKEKVLPTEEEITQYINNEKQQTGMTEDDFQKRLKEQNMTPEMLREETRKLLAIRKLQDKIYGRIDAPSAKEVEDFYNNNRDQFVNARGVGLAAIIVDPADNGLPSDAKGEIEAKQKIDLIYQQLKSGADFATVAREKSEDGNSALRGGDIGFATEEDLKQNNFPETLVAEFFNKMEVGSYTTPTRFNNRWYIFKLQRKQLQSENLTLDSPGVRQQIAQALVDQRKQILNSALLVDAMSDSKVANNLAKNMLDSPNNLGGPRMAQPASATVSSSPPATTSPETTESPAASPEPTK